MKVFYNLLFLFSVISLSTQSSESELNHCLWSKGSSCLATLEQGIGNESPELLMDNFEVIKKLREQVTYVSLSEFNKDISVDYHALNSSLNQCIAITKNLQPNFISLEDRERMCQSSSVKSVVDEYSGFSLFPSTIKKKMDAQTAYHREIIKQVTNLALAKQTVALAQLKTMYRGRIPKNVLPDAQLSPQDCKNIENDYPLDTHNAILNKTQTASMIGKPNKLSDQEFANTKNNLVSQILKIRGKIKSACEDSEYSAVGPYLDDPLVANLVLNNISNYSAPTQNILKASYCRYAKIKEGLSKVHSTTNWLFDGTTFVVGFLGPIGMGISTTANITLYSTLAGQKYQQLIDAREKHLVGLSSDDYLVQKENEYTETLSHAAIIIAAEAISWALPGVGRVIAKRLAKLMKNGKLAQLIASGAIKLVGKEFTFMGKTFSLKTMPSETLAAFTRALKNLKHLSIAKASKINVKSLTSTVDELAEKFGNSKSKEFLEYVGLYGRKGLSGLSCNSYMVTAASSTYVLTSGH